MERTQSRPLVTGELSDRRRSSSHRPRRRLGRWSRPPAELARGRALARRDPLLRRRLHADPQAPHRAEHRLGRIAGCMPVLIGWAAVTGSLAWAAVILFGVIFLWTPPHYWPLSMRYSDDYAEVGVPMLAVVRGRTGSACRSCSTRGRRSPARCCSSRWRHMGLLYSAVALLAGGWFIYESHRLYNRAIRHGRVADAGVPRLDHLPDAPLPRGRDRSAAAVLSVQALTTDAARPRRAPGERHPRGLRSLPGPGDRPAGSRCRDPYTLESAEFFVRGRTARTDLASGRFIVRALRESSDGPLLGRHRGAARRSAAGRQRSDAG